MRQSLDSNLDLDLRRQWAVLDAPAVERSSAWPLFEILNNLDRQVEHALELGAELDLSGSPDELAHIVFCGMGGSAIGGDLLASYLRPELAIPFIVNREPGLPGWVSERSLVVACSYSGNTEETLQALSHAQKRGAWICGISSGGRLAELASDWRFPRIELPPGLPPRMTLIYGMIPVLVLLQRLGVCGNRGDDVRRSLDFVRSCCRNCDPAAPIQVNLAKQLAALLLGRVPVVVGSTGGLEVLARRWAGQLCENAKVLGFFDALPESAHNQIVGWLEAGFDPSIPLISIWLKDSGEPPLVRRQREWIVARMDRLGVARMVVESHGNNRLERIWSLLVLGDYASLYLAHLGGRDPQQVKSIDEMKLQIATRNSQSS